MGSRQPLPPPPLLNFWFLPYTTRHNQIISKGARVKRLLRVLAIVCSVVVAVAVMAAAFLLLKKPAQREALQLQIERTPERLARGEYLVRHVAICFDCHSERDAAYALPFKPGGEGARGFIWNEGTAFPGFLAASNITPDRETGLGSWSDGEILRALREGVDRHGEALFPIMPYAELRALSDEDAHAIIAYLRTLRPIPYQEPEKHLRLPLNIVEKFVPKPLEGPVSSPDRRDTVAYGRYLTTIASCRECHTPKDERNNQIAGQEFSGGYEMHGPGFAVVTTNITPHPTNWMGQVSRENFIARFKAYENYQPTPAPKGTNTLMPWLTFSGMSEEDLGAIYDYLKTVPPIEKKVMPFEKARGKS